MGKLRTTRLRQEEQYPVVDDMKLKLTLIAFADKYSASVRALIYKAYEDLELMRTYQAIRNSGIYEKGKKEGAFRRKIVEFPNAYVYDFVDTVLKELYGPEWLQNTKALKHDLVRPWLVVSRL